MLHGADADAAGEYANRTIDIAQRITSPDLWGDIAGDLGDMGVVENLDPRNW